MGNRATLLFVLLSLIFSVLLFESACAQNKIRNYLKAHNAVRKAVGVPMPNMVWNTTVASYARNYAKLRAEDCKLLHSNGPYGENLAYGYSRRFSGRYAVGLWAAEKKYYSYRSNSCIGQQECLHYTQIVWSDSIRLGCARVKCSNGYDWFVVCNYDPPGNWVGELPY
ncbi:hypothetical protein MLD38_026707 [Melastoma candidum]|uniref:Uncharacterized protein n=1 Tax=Melastoma candidum TaxID=119954 RepID=A0ACB9P0C5_9MYRT|nr:hypothetical protein MLD38_026707 [Melastoma candidum]